MCQLSSDWVKQRQYLEPLVDGWKGEGTLAPDPKNLHLAEKTVIALHGKIPEPVLYADVDGSAELYWENQKLSVTLNESDIWINIFQQAPLFLNIPVGLEKPEEFAAEQILKHWTIINK